MVIPTPPAPRIPYDIDGSVVLISRTASEDHSPMEIDYLPKASLNSNLSVGVTIGTDLWSYQTQPPANAPYYAKNWLAVVFPRPMDVRGWFSSVMVYAYQTYQIAGVNYPAGLNTLLQISTDSTNGQDGTWTTVAEKLETDYRLPWLSSHPTQRPATTPPYVLGSGSDAGEIHTTGNVLYHDEGVQGPGWSEVSGANGVNAVRLYFPRIGYLANPGAAWVDSGGRGTLLLLHLYGEPSSDSENRLTLVNADDSGPAELAFGDLPLGEYATHAIKVKNLSSSEDASNVRLTAELGIPLLPPESHFAIRFSLNGEDWLPSVRIGTVSAEGLSPEVLLRVDPPDGIVGQHFVRVHAVAGEWS